MFKIPNFWSKRQKSKTEPKTKEPSPNRTETTAPSSVSAAPIATPASKSQKHKPERVEAAKPAHLHKYHDTPGDPRCDDCGYQPSLDRSTSNAPFVAAGFDASGRPTVIEVFPDGTRVEARGNPARELLER